MRLIAAAAILLTSMAAVVGAGAACSTQARASVALMKMVPEETGHFAYWAIADLNEDDDLWSIYDKFKESSDTQQLGDLVQVLAIVEDSARILDSDNVAMSEPPVTVFRADFDTKYVENRLKTLGYSRSVYRNVDIWTVGDGQPNKPVALMSGRMLIGDASKLKSCVDIAKGSTGSLYDDPYIKVLADKLPDGIVMDVDRAGTFSTENYIDLVAYGKSYSKSKSDSLKVTAVYVFGDGPAAGAAQQSVKVHLSVRFRDVKVSRKDNLVIGTGKISVSDFAQGLQF